MPCMPMQSPDCRRPLGAAVSAPSGRLPEVQQTGYRGRIGIYEFVPVTQAIQQGILARASASDLQEIAGRRSDYRSLRADGLLKARAGITTIDEVLRVTGAAESYAE